MIENRAAHYNYTISDTIEAGIVLQGSEIKSIRAGAMTLADSFITISGGEVFLHNSNITKYANAGAFVPEPKRTRKLLMHKSEIEKLTKVTKEKGMALVPLKVYFKSGKAKLLVGVGKGKKLYNKKETLRTRDTLRQAQRDIKAMR